jgi:uncharacterized protein (DUF952 family)
MADFIYHITERDSWQKAQQAGAYRADSLATQGFIHLSKRHQVEKVANAIYRGKHDLVLLVIDTAKLIEALKYEPPDTQIHAAHYEGELFPHLYGELNLEAVVKVVDFPPTDEGMFKLPEGI